MNSTQQCWRLESLGRKTKSCVDNVTARAFSDPGTATSQSSPPPSLVEFLPSVGIEPCTLGFKYMFNAFPPPTRTVTDKELELLKVFR
ncbi:hypothetical protein QL285_082400 [Trifolium repens]|nr:hypothetical protein QL285_082400 [Trifolium repens]